MSSTTGPLRGLVSAVARPVGLFVLTVTAGVLGFVLIAGVDAVEAAFWLLDPSSIGFYFASHEGPERLTKGFALVVYTALVLSGLWIGESVLDTVFGGQFREELRYMQTRQSIDNLSDHTIICGYGMFGRTVAERLQARGEDVVVVERDPEVLDRVDADLLSLRGDARRDDVLREAGVERARALVAGIDDANVNIQIGIVTSQLAPDARLVVRVGEEMSESLARRAGADTVVIPEVVSGTDVVENLRATRRGDASR